MPDFINAAVLKDAKVDGSKKYKGTVYLKKDCFLKMEGIEILLGSSSRNDVIEKAIDFYFAFSASQLNQDYLCGVFGSKIEGLINTLGTRISKGNFRNAVEMNMLTRLLATEVQVNRSEYDKLRVKSIQEVKKTNGSIDLLEAVNENESGDLSE